MKTPVQRDWLTPQEKTALDFLKRRYETLVDHVRQHQEAYKGYIRVAFSDIHGSFNAQQEPVRELLFVAVTLAQVYDSEIVKLITSYELETTPSRPRTLTETFSGICIHLNMPHRIEDAGTKVLFLLLAGVFRKEF